MSYAHTGYAVKARMENKLRSESGRAEGAAGAAPAAQRHQRRGAGGDQGRAPRAARSRAQQALAGGRRRVGGGAVWGSPHSQRTSRSATPSRTAPHRAAPRSIAFALFGKWAGRRAGQQGGLAQPRLGAVVQDAPSVSYVLMYYGELPRSVTDRTMTTL